jgi:hypothetical protein
MLMLLVKHKDGCVEGVEGIDKWPSCVVYRTSDTVNISV